MCRESHFLLFKRLKPGELPAASDIFAANEIAAGRTVTFTAYRASRADIELGHAEGQVISPHYKP